MASVALQAWREDVSCSAFYWSLVTLSLRWDGSAESLPFDLDQGFKVAILLLSCVKEKEKEKESAVK